MSIVGSNVLGGAASGDLPFQYSVSLHNKSIEALVGFNNQFAFTVSFWVKNFIFDTNSLLFRTVAVDTYPHTGFKIQLRNAPFLLSPGGFSVIYGKQESFNNEGYSEFRNIIGSSNDSWMHVCVNVNTLDAALPTGIYINGLEVKDHCKEKFKAPIPFVGSRTGIGGISGQVRMILGGAVFHDFHYVDGITLPPTSFGKLSTQTGEWEPIKYQGTHGSWGAHLAFEDGSTVESLLANTASSSSVTWAPSDGSLIYPIASVYSSQILDSPMAFVAPYGNTASLNILRGENPTQYTPLPAGSIGGVQQERFFDIKERSHFDLTSTTYRPGETLVGKEWDQGAAPGFPSYDNGGPYADYKDQDILANCGAFATRGIGPGMKTYYEIKVVEYEATSGLSPPEYRPWFIFLGPQNPSPWPWPFNYTNVYPRYDVPSTPTYYTAQTRLDGNDVQSWDPDGGIIYEYENGVLTATTVNPAYKAVAGDVLAVAADYDAGTIDFYKNGVFLKQTTVANAEINGTPDWLPGFVPPREVINDGTVYPSRITVNFGRTPFVHAPPEGYKSLSAANYTDPPILNPLSQLQIIRRYAGEPGDIVINTRFAPQMVMSWHQQRPTGNAPIIGGFASKDMYVQNVSEQGKRIAIEIRPDSNPPYYNWRDQYTAYTISGSSVGIKEFNSSNFVLGPNVAGGYNLGSNRYSYYIWKDPGIAAVVNQVGSINSSVVVNQAAGLSYVSWDGNGQQSGTIGHGLAKRPLAIINTTLGDSSSPPAAATVRITQIYQKDLSSKFGTLGSAYLGIAFIPNYWATYGYIPAPTNWTEGTFSITGAPQVDAVNQTFFRYWAMAITPVSGFSKVGSYVGTGGGTGEAPYQGKYVDCGFKPAMVYIYAYNNGSASSDEAVAQYIFDFKDSRAPSTSGHNLLAGTDRFYPAEILRQRQYSSDGVTPAYNSAAGGDVSPAGAAPLVEGYGALVTPLPNGFLISSSMLSWRFNTAGQDVISRPLNAYGVPYFYIAFASTAGKYAQTGFAFPTQDPGDYSNDTFQSTGANPPTSFSID